MLPICTQTRTHKCHPGPVTLFVRHAAGEILPSWRFGFSFMNMSSLFSLSALTSRNTFHSSQTLSQKRLYSCGSWFPQQNRLSSVTISPREYQTQAGFSLSEKLCLWEMRDCIKCWHKASFLSEWVMRALHFKRIHSPTLVKVFCWICSAFKHIMHLQIKQWLHLSYSIRRKISALQ